MKVRILVSQPDGAVLNGEPWPPVGAEVELPTALAAHLVGSEVAEEVVNEPKPRARKSRRGDGDG